MTDINQTKVDKKFKFSQDCSLPETIKRSLGKNLITISNLVFKIETKLTLEGRIPFFETVQLQLKCREIHRPVFFGNVHILFGRFMFYVRGEIKI